MSCGRQDPEALQAAQRKFAAFERDLAAAEPRLKDVNDAADRMVADGHASAAEIDASRKNLNERFDALKDKVCP